MSVHVPSHIKASTTWKMSSQYEACNMYWLRILVAESTGSHDCKVCYITVIIFCGSLKVPEFKFPTEWSQSCQQSKKHWCFNRWPIKTPFINTGRAGWYWSWTGTFAMWASLATTQEIGMSQIVGTEWNYWHYNFTELHLFIFWRSVVQQLLQSIFSQFILMQWLQFFKLGLVLSEWTYLYD
jgi:hypothetical protein